MSAFTAWIPMYPSGSHLVRPWWRIDASQHPVFSTYEPPRWTRTDGRHGCYIVRDGDGWPQLSGEPRTDEEVTACLARIDADHPLPVPPPMAGQVWQWPGGEQHLVGKVFGGDTGGATLANGPFYPGKEWPPHGAVLVAGPTPWGRDRPWAPPGWAP